MKEMNIIFDDCVPEGFIVNEEARNEMLRIGRAAHMKQDFTIFQPTFFSVRKHGHVPQARNNPTFDLPQNYPFMAGLGLQSSSSQGSSLFGSSRSVDSNISQSSVPSTSGRRYVEKQN